MTTFNGSIAIGTDDGQAGSGAGYNNNAGGMQLGGYFGTANGWYRFTNVTVDQYANVSACTFSSTRITAAGTAADLSFYFVKEANPATISSDADFNGRTLTTAFVNQSYSGSTGAFDSPDLSTPVAEIFQQASWANGNSIILFIKDNGSNAHYGGFENRVQINAYDGGTFVPTISITWTAGTPPATGQPARIRMGGIPYAAGNCHRGTKSTRVRSW